MALGAYQGTATDNQGNVLGWPFNVRVMRESDGGTPTLAAIYSDRAGTTALPNPMAVTAADGFEAGFFRFYAAGGAYRILVYNASEEAEELRHVAIGTMGETDSGLLNDPGYLLAFEAGTAAPPTAGSFRTDNADLSLATTLYVSKTTQGGESIAQRLSELGVGDILHIASPFGEAASWLVDSVADATGYVAVSISWHDGGTSFTAGELFAIQTLIAGADAYVYLAYASDDAGTGFTTTFNAALDYIAIKHTTTAIAAPVAADFAGLWKKYKGADGAVLSVAGLTGAISGTALKTALALVKADVGLGNVDNTADADKPVSTAQAAAINKATKTVVILTDVATPALDASAVSVFQLTAGGNRTIAVPSNASNGQKIIIRHTASGADRTLALNTGAEIGRAHV